MKQAMYTWVGRSSFAKYLNFDVYEFGIRLKETICHWISIQAVYKFCMTPNGFWQWRSLKLISLRQRYTSTAKSNYRRASVLEVFVARLFPFTTLWKRLIAPLAAPQVVTYNVNLMISRFCFFRIKWNKTVSVCFEAAEKNQFMDDSLSVTRN